MTNATETPADDFDFDAVFAPDYQPAPPTVGIRVRKAYKGRANLAATDALFESDGESADRENSRAY